MALDAKTRAQQVLETLYPDPTVRAARAEELGEAGLVTLGNNVLRQDEFSRSMNELGSKKAEADGLYQSNKDWFDQKQKDLEELDALRKQVAAGTGNGHGTTGTGTTGTTTPPVGITKEELDRTLALTEQGAVAFFTDLNSLSLQHFQQFGEVLDTTKLITDKRVQQIGLRGVYADQHKEQLDARAQKSRQDAEDKIRLDERQKVLAAQASSQHPYPIRGNEPGTLDALEAARTGSTPQPKSVDDLVNEYARLNAGRAG
jgi:hypothetical protein